MIMTKIKIAVGKKLFELSTNVDRINKNFDIMQEDKAVAMESLMRVTAILDSTKLSAFEVIFLSRHMLSLENLGHRCLFIVKEK